MTHQKRLSLHIYPLKGKLCHNTKYQTGTLLDNLTKLGLTLLSEMEDKRRRRNVLRFVFILFRVISTMELSTRLVLVLLT